MTHQHRADTVRTMEMAQSSPSGGPPEAGAPIYVVPIEVCRCGFVRYDYKNAKRGGTIGALDQMCPECAMATANGGSHVH